MEVLHTADTATAVHDQILTCAVTQAKKFIIQVLLHSQSNVALHVQANSSQWYALRLRIYPHECRYDN